MDKDELTTMEKLKGEQNWVMWKCQTKVFLNADDLFDIVNRNGVPDRSKYGGESAQAEYDKDFAAWKKNDNKAQKIIVRTMAHEPMMHIINCDTAYAMWTKLESMYEQKSSTSIHSAFNRQYFGSVNDV